MNLVYLIRVALLIGVFFTIGLGVGARPEITTMAGTAAKLDISPVYQQTPVWCWAAVGEMVFRYYDVPTINPRRGYQCGVVSGLGGPCWNDCTACRVSAGQLDIISAMIETYPKIAAEMTSLETRSIRVQDQSAPISPIAVIKEIDAGRPIIAGISPSGMRYPPQIAEHVALIIGYRGGPDRLTLIVNDPFPFRETGARDPYSASGGERLQRGQYRIRYEAFIQRLKWNNTIFDID